jgi:hypothetical protein
MCVRKATILLQQDAKVQHYVDVLNLEVCPSLLCIASSDVCGLLHLRR